MANTIWKKKLHRDAFQYQVRIDGSRALGASLEEQESDLISDKTSSAVAARMLIFLEPCCVGTQTSDKTEAWKQLRYCPNCRFVKHLYAESYTMHKNTVYNSKDTPVWWRTNVER